MDNEAAKDRRSFLGVAGALAAGAALAARGQEVAAGPGGKVRIVALSCSPRKGKTTAAGLVLALEGAKAANPERIETELIDLASMSIPVFDPGASGRTDFDVLVPTLSDPRVGGILIGTPVYFGSMSSLCKAFLDHCMAFRKGGMMLRNKVAGVLAVGAVRNGGQELAINGVQAALLCQEMIVVGDGRPTAHTGATLLNTNDSIAGDEFGIETARNLGRHVAEVALLLAPTAAQ
jgi:multimeric flavodoxin WrbA